MGSKIHSPPDVFSAGTLDTAGLLFIKRVVFDHQPLLPAGISLSFLALSLVNLTYCFRMPALHASAASRSFGVPSDDRFASTRFSISLVSQGFVDFFLGSVFWARRAPPHR